MMQDLRLRLQQWLGMQVVRLDGIHSGGLGNLDDIVHTVSDCDGHGMLLLLLL